MSTASLLRRLDQLEKAIKLKRPRIITLAVDGDIEDQSAADALVQELDPRPDDLVIYMRHFGIRHVSGDKSDLPKLLSVSNM